MALNVLSSMNLDLRTDVLAPFRSEATMLNYAQQILDFWSHDMRAIAAQINAPVLLIGSEYDKIASPNTSRSAIPFFSKARSLQIQGASHYCLYDHPALIARLIEDFFRNPNDKGGVCGEVREVQLMEAATT
jgi:pimeloyl-ACP methyl ester carboxylesterase